MGNRRNIWLFGVIATLLMILSTALPIKAEAASASFLGLSGQFLYPPCLRSDMAIDATIPCVSESIIYYTGILLVLIAIGAFLYILYGAFLYVTAYGDEAKTKQAKEAIKYAIIGMIIAILARLAVALIKNFLQA